MLVLVNHRKPYNYCQKLYYQTVLNCPLRYEHLKKLSKEQHCSEKLMEKVGLPIYVMEVINPDTNLGKWIHNLGLVYPHIKLILQDPTYSDLYKKVQQQHIQLVQIANKFLYLYKRNPCRTVIPEGFKFEGTSAIYNLIDQAHNSWGHAGVELTYEELADKYIWQNIYKNPKDFVKSYKICQLIKGSTQLPVGLLTLLNVPTKP